MSSSPDKAANLKPKRVVVPKVWKRPHSTIYGKNVEFGNKLYSDKLGEINGRKFNSELPWQVRNSGPSSSAGSSSSQGYLSNLFNEPHSTTIGSVITASGRREAGERAASSSPWWCSSSSSSSSSPSSWSPSLSQSRSQLQSPSASLDKYCDRKSRLTPESCANYADVLELTNPNRYSKRRSEHALVADRRRVNELLARMSQAEQQQQQGQQQLNQSDKPTRIDFYDNYLEFSQEINRLNESSRLANDPLLQRRIFDKYLDFNYELGLFVPNYSSDSATAAAAAAASARGARSRRVIFDDDGRSLVHKKTIHWQPEVAADGHHATTGTSASFSAQRRHQPQAQPQPQEEHPYGPMAHYRPLDVQPRDRSMDPTNDHASHDSPHPFNPVVCATKQTHLLPKHACQLADSPYGQSADGRKLSLGSINPHSYRPSLPQKTTTVHASDGEEFEFRDRSSPFYTDRWAGRTIRHFDSDLYSNASLFKSMIL